MKFESAAKTRGDFAGYLEAARGAPRAGFTFHDDDNRRMLSFHFSARAFRRRRSRRLFCLHGSYWPKRDALEIFTDACDTTAYLRRRISTPPHWSPFLFRYIEMPTTFCHGAAI